MPGKRSRQGCGECRKRRRKCDETKPSCGQCVANNRTCQYELRLVWSQRAREPRNGMLNMSIGLISLINCDAQLPAILSAWSILTPLTVNLTYQYRSRFQMVSPYLGVTSVYCIISPRAFWRLCQVIPLSTKTSVAV